MAVGGVETVVQQLPGGEWSYHAALGLIGTFATGTALNSGLHTTTSGLLGILALGVATAVAFGAAYLEAAALDEREAQR